METGKIYCFNERFLVIEQFSGHVETCGKDAGKEKINFLNA